MIRVPTAVGLLICDQVIVEEGTHNVTPVNCWSRREYAGFPSGPQTFVALAFLTEGFGEMTLELIIHSLDNWDEVYRSRKAVRFDDVLREYRCTYRARDISFPAAGDYQVSLHAAGEIVAQRKLMIREAKP